MLTVTDLATLECDLLYIISEVEDEARDAILSLTQSFISEARNLVLYIEDLSSENNDLNASLEEVREELAAECEARVEALSSENNYLSASLEEVREELAAESAEREALEDEVYELNQKLEDLEEYAETISDLRCKVENLELRNNLLESGSPFSAYIRELRSITQRQPNLDDIPALARSAQVDFYQEQLALAHADYEGYSKGLATWQDLSLAVRCAQIDTALNHPIEEAASFIVRPVDMRKPRRFHISFNLTGQEVLLGVITEEEAPGFMFNLLQVNPDNIEYHEEKDFLGGYLNIALSKSTGKITRVTLQIFPDEFGQYNVNSFCEFKVYIEKTNKKLSVIDEITTSEVELSCKIRFLHLSLAMSEVSLLLPT